MSKQSNPAERAYQAFATQPLAALCGVDRASFISGYDTAAQHQAELVEALRAAQIIIENLPAPPRSVERKAIEKIRALLARIDGNG